MTLEEKYEIVRKAVVNMVGSDDPSELKKMKLLILASAVAVGLPKEEIAGPVQLIDCLLLTHEVH